LLIPWRKTLERNLSVHAKEMTMAKKVRAASLGVTKDKSSTGPTAKKKSERSRMAVKLIASEALNSLNAVSLQLQGLALHGGELPKFGDDATNNMAKHIAVHGVLSALIERRANPTFLKKGWSGSLESDYHFSEQDFPSFLDNVASALLPTYHFKPSEEFRSAQLKNTLGGLAAAVNLAIKP
jgi:hypothetical protein